MTSHHTPINSLYLSALFSQLVYSNPKDASIKFFNIVKEYPGIILEDNIKLEYYCNKNYSAQAYSWNIENNTYLVFRGTKGLRDIFIDMDIRRNDLDLNKGFQVHNGFHNQFFSLEKDISSFLNNKDIKNLYCVGHSLGGGLASIAAAYYSNVYENSIPINLHTFGSPRVGNNSFVKYIENSNINNWRVYNKNDFVSEIPLSRRFFHVNKYNLCLDYKEKETHKKNKDCIFPRTCDLIRSINIKKPLYGHNVNTYIKNLKLLL